MRSLLIFGEHKHQRYLPHAASCSETAGFYYLQVHIHSDLQMAKPSSHVCCAEKLHAKEKFEYTVK